MAYGPHGFSQNNVVGNYLAGRQAADQEHQSSQIARARDQQYEQNILTQQQQQTQLSEEQQKAFATKMVQAAQYGIQSQTPKAFIEQNYPQLAQLAGEKWASATDEDVKASLQDAIGTFGPVAGIGPASAKGVSGAMYKVVNPETGEITYATAEEARGQNPYVYTPPTKAPPGEKRPAPPRGYRYVSGGDGVEPIPGGPNDPNAPNRPTQAPKPATEGDKRARVMYFSMKNAEKQLEAVTSADTSDLGQAILGKVGLDVAKSDDYKRYEAGGLRWAANLLYLKSGATATPDEIRSTWLQFFPQPGDGPTVKAQKDEARSQEMFAINDTYSFEKGAAPAAPSGAVNWADLK